MLITTSDVSDHCILAPLLMLAAVVNCAHVSIGVLEHCIRAHSVNAYTVVETYMLQSRERTLTLHRTMQMYMSVVSSDSSIVVPCVVLLCLNIFICIPLLVPLDLYFSPSE